MSFSKTVVLPATPDEAFDLITQPERLRRWLTIAARVDLRVGGAYRWTVVPGMSAAGTFTEVEPGKRVVFTWDWEGEAAMPAGLSTVSVTMEETAGGTAVTLSHHGLSPDQEAGHAEGWSHYLDRLVVLATTGDAGADEWPPSPVPFTELTGAEATLAVIQRVLAGLTPADMNLPTPCEEFTVEQLVGHLQESVGGIAAALGARDVQTDDGSPEERIAALAQATLEAFAARGLEGTIDMGFAQVPANIVANILNLEFLVHAWDFSAATGRPLEVAPALSDYVLELARKTINQQLRDGGSFGPENIVAESADSLERLIAFTGRRPELTVTT
ncbi:TIGR03086 family metal-binding protein [Arthrobacter sp. ISL-30]|uniref:TIGR03086 family metal-binding protein n=1 Tax=Arthrobacter sp. ISL-30 TaxID=2819109 RepID=UPI001BEBE895|nr:TIGR03086 family metal-binding protein [Arthrobacter sp. ISL-30]MBT2513470.1 TIGR03086 family protein [Arthrobacter sp. ISL-30]